MTAGRAPAATPPRAGVQPLASPKENVSLVVNSSTGICIANIDGSKAGRVQETCEGDGVANTEYRLARAGYGI